MSSGPGPKARSVIKTKSFENGFALLPGLIQQECLIVYQEMFDGKYRPSRDLKIIRGTRKTKQKVWQVRLTRDYRMRFHFKKGSGEITLLLVGPHKLFD